MAKNANLIRASKVKHDEFYTQIADIEREMKHYISHFKDKVIFCNCDDPEYSNFWRFFQLNFYRLGLKKLISTHYEENKPSYKMEIVSTNTDNGQDGVQIGIPDYVKTPLRQNGDFRSPECIEILKEAEILLPTWIQSHDSFENEPPFEYPLNPLFSNRYQHRKRSEPLTFISCPEHFLC